MTRPKAASARSSVISRLPVPAVSVAVAVAITAMLLPRGRQSYFYLVTQDQWLILIGGLLLAVAALLPGRRDAAFSATWRLALTVAAVMAVATFVGHYLILSGHDLSIDEKHANFDAAIFARGQIAAPLPELWYEHTRALNTMFMYPTDHREAWVSGYLPGNAALRTLIGFVAAPELTGPLMTALALLVLWACVRHIWPERREAPVVALLLFVGTGQVWLNGMTAYAMPAHLALNLCWLWLFLQRNWRADIGALLVGFVAVGLHQMHYHPLFAAPLLFLLVLERDWRRAAFFALGYLAIGAIWQSWSLLSASAVVGGPLPITDEKANYISRVWNNFLLLGDIRYPEMVANVIRMIAWEHILLIPLFVIGIRAARRDRLAAALLAGIVLTLISRLVLQPVQGLGFGYRNTHGLIGNFILIAVYGWNSLRDDIGRWRMLLLRTTAASCLVLLPIQAWMGHRLYDASARISARIGQAGTDYAVVGAYDVPYSQDLATNPPYLDARPIRLVRERVDPSLQSGICAAHASVAIVDSDVLQPLADHFRTKVDAAAAAKDRKIAESLSKAGCRVTFL